MKPIQEYTKQEKLEAILEYNPYRTERNAVLRYLLARPSGQHRTDRLFREFRRQRTQDYP